MNIILSVVILVVTLALILTRPRNVSEALAASLGGVCVLGLGLVPVREAGEILREASNVLTFLVGMMAVSSVAEKAGFFEWAGSLTIRAGRGSVFRLYCAVFVIGTLVTITLSLDATAIVLTPVVFGMTRTLGIKPLPFMFACCYTANTGSLLLPISNLTNLLMYEAFNLELLRFALIMALPATFAILTNALIFIWLFRSDIRDVYTQVDKPFIAENTCFYRFATGALTTVLFGVVVASLLDIPIGVVAMGGAVITAAIASLFRWTTLRQVSGSVSWQLLPLVVGLFLVVRGVENAGFDILAQRAFLAAAPGDGFLQILAIAFGTALGSNLINNVPMTVVTINDLSPLLANGSLNETAAYAALIGTNVGPNLTVVGSLATLIWLGIIRGRGLVLTARDYLVVGLITTPAILVMASFGLWLSVRLFEL
ncbi:ArsB/NhaD family transporter [soil metagenome]